MTMMMCFRRIANVRSLVSPRSAGVCWLEPASWRHRQTPVTECARLKRSQVSGSWLVRLKGTDSRVGCWSGILPQVKPTGWHEQGTVLLYRGGHERSAASFRSLLSPNARGLCSGKKETPDSSPAADRPEAGAVPGQGLFKFKELYENPWTIPNVLCVCRILLAPFLGHLIIQQHFHLSLALFALAGATDLLDGYIARTWPTQKSALGSALDPLADKILVSILYVSLTYAELIPAPLTALVIFRDIGLIAAVFWVRYKTVPPPVTLSKFFNPCYTTAQLKPTLFSKVNTAIQLFLVAASLAAPVFQYTDSVLLQCIWYVTAVTTAASGYSYWHYGRKTVQVLNTRSP
ncbi:cardiolipin synthase (CMP-forming) [Seriola lalandi dorsalis]|uniref:Cardiolipin synthase (CMP-forming) n=1 Tax=Seriola lalandi dorsalis TaxID=1841481 RepID=A0A3B4Y129_SERLL|nr:cardiolipin synthase (CMP-forming) [Seriola lalandi dorsalis]XP_056252293.1 cardiolipin synthase (CMP-forming) [Seriola aureovittata]